MSEDIINFNHELPSIKKQYHEYQIVLFNSNSKFLCMKLILPFHDVNVIYIFS